jgi:hypothetical protein
MRALHPLRTQNPHSLQQGTKGINNTQIQIQENKTHTTNFATALPLGKNCSTWNNPQGQLPGGKTTINSTARIG